jgi:hypothetical protein
MLSWLTFSLTLTDGVAHIIWSDGILYSSFLEKVGHLKFLEKVKQQWLVH